MREQLEDDILAVAYRLFARDGYDETTVEQIAAESGISVRAFHRCFRSKDATLAIVGLRSVERTLEDLPPEPVIAELVQRLAEAFDAWFARDGAEIALRLMKDHPAVVGELPVWRREWSTRLAHGLAAHADRERPNLRDRVVSSIAMEVIGIALDERMHQPGSASLRDLASAMAGSLDAVLGEAE